MINKISGVKRIILNKINLILFISLIPVCCIAYNDNLQQSFLNTENQIKQRKIKNIDQIPKNLYRYSLFPYLELNILSNKLYSNPVNEIKEFYEKYDDQPVTKQLNFYWITYLAKNNRWEDVLKYYKKNNSTKLECIYTMAKQKVEPENVTKEEMDELWLYGKSRPKKCRN